MSDRVAKSEIEDVLSSIRRLVSEEGRKLPLKQLAASGVKPDRLVLTPALRVGETAEDPAGDISESGVLVTEPEKSRKPEAQKGTDTPADSDAGAALRASGGAEAMVLCSSQLVEPEDTSPRGAGTDKSGDTSVQKPATAGGMGKSRIGPLEEELADSLSAKIEALETAIAQTEDQWEPDGDSDDAYAGTRVRRITLRLTDDPADIEPEPAAADQETPESGEGTRTTASGPEDAPQGSEEMPPPRFVHVPQPEKRPASSNEGRASGPKPAESVSETDENDLDLRETLLDDEALRQMVADIVREELQGALGERITRNVRKLVRREIQIALAARDLK